MVELANPNNKLITTCPSCGMILLYLEEDIVQEAYHYEDIEYRLYYIRCPYCGQLVSLNN